MKKGFIFVETMVCIAFLGTVLLTVYASFTNVLDSAKSRLLYDDPIYLYRTYYILNFLEENGLNEYINDKFISQNNNTSYISEFGCSSAAVVGDDAAVSGDPKSEKVFCEKILQNGQWNVNHVFIMPYNVNKIVNCVNNDDIKSGAAANCRRNTALKNLSVQAVNYLYSLDGYTGSAEEDDILSLTETNDTIDPTKQIYRIVVEFKVPDKTEEYTYYDYCLKSGGTCSDFDPETSKKTTTVTRYKYYYTSLEIPNGYNQMNTGEGYNLRLTYDGNGGTWCATSDSPWILKAGTSYAVDKLNGDVLTLPAASIFRIENPHQANGICFEKENYLLIPDNEWNTRPDGSGIAVEQGAETSPLNLAQAVDCDLGDKPCSITLYANWKPKIDYTIGYDLKGGTEPSTPNPTTYTVIDTITLNPPTKGTEFFSGWTGTDLSGKTKDVTIGLGAEGDRFYEANWISCTPCSASSPYCQVTVENDVCKYTCTGDFTCKDEPDVCNTPNINCSYGGNYKNSAGMYFSTLDEALDNTDNSQTISLLVDGLIDNSTPTLTNDPPKNLTLDLNGKTLNLINTITISKGGLIIQNGTIKSSKNRTIHVKSGGNLIIGSNTGGIKTNIVNTYNATTSAKGQTIIYNEGNTNIKAATAADTVLEAGKPGQKFAKGIDVLAGATFTLTNGTIKATANTGQGATGIDSKGTTKLKGGEIYVSKLGYDSSNGGRCGICVNSGVTTISGHVKVSVTGSLSDGKDGGAIGSARNGACMLITSTSNLELTCTNESTTKAMYCIAAPYGKIRYANGHKPSVTKSGSNIKITSKNYAEGTSC